MHFGEADRTSAGELIRLGVIAVVGIGVWVGDKSVLIGELRGEFAVANVEDLAGFAPGCEYFDCMLDVSC